MPLFSDAGRGGWPGPLIVEYKFSNNRAWMSVAKSSWKRATPCLRRMTARNVIESFHPGAVNWYKEHHPEVCRGQLSWPAKLSKNGAG